MSYSILKVHFGITGQLLSNIGGRTTATFAAYLGTGQYLWPAGARLKCGGGIENF